MGSFTPSEWDPVYKNCCEGLQPGGWIKQLEENPRVHYDDGSVPDNKCAWVLEDEACKAADNWGRPITVADTMKSSLEKAGFVDVHAKTYKWPIGAWIKDPVLKEAGNLHYHQWASEPGGGVWAPTLRYHKGVFYVAAASFSRYRPQEDDRVWPQGFYVKTTNIWDDATWSNPVYFDQVGFDQDLFWDDDGTVYLSSTYRKLERTPNANIKDFAVHVCTVDLDTGHSTSEPRLIRESVSGVAEGSHIFKRGRYYYLFTAEGGTESGHCEWVSRSADGPFGPWELGPNNPLWLNGVEDEVQNTGHADLVEDAGGQWWAVLLGVRPVQRGDKWEESVLGRETFLVPVNWENDWPVIDGGKISLQMTGPGLYHQTKAVSWKDDFSQPELKIGWYRKNTPLTTDYSLTERPNHLRLHGGPYNLSVPACPTLFLRKQIHRFCTWETKLSFQPDSEHIEAGTVLWWNYFTYTSLGIRRINGTNRILRLRQSDGNTSDYELSLATDVILVIECGDQYRFGYCESTDSEINWIGTVDNLTAAQAPPVGAPFTGMMLGLYAFGERQRSMTPADFSYAEFK
ncbi:hypothetical protein N7466_006805 [Penicillium verhagenii]|uniref:uncharacterized protein n=1 Tax=Penicillium verhagenii TaxID=1562060 RepID=UPI002545BD15|nr:uncharacterized protein N7466_006805 [Penicillium verhagenii]KAJ5927849.1 hypothetical protein N7466_006805 [Penicillium verhagenii]